MAVLQGVRLDELESATDRFIRRPKVQALIEAVARELMLHHTLDSHTVKSIIAEVSHPAASFNDQSKFTPWKRRISRLIEEWFFADPICRHCEEPFESNFPRQEKSCPSCRAEIIQECGCAWRQMELFAHDQGMDVTAECLHRQILALEGELGSLDEKSISRSLSKFKPH